MPLTPLSRSCAACRQGAQPTARWGHWALAMRVFTQLHDLRLDLPANDTGTWPYNLTVSGTGPWPHRPLPSCSIYHWTSQLMTPGLGRAGLRPVARPAAQPCGQRHWALTAPWDLAVRFHGKRYWALAAQVFTQLFDLLLDLMTNQRHWDLAAQPHG